MLDHFGGERHDQSETEIGEVLISRSICRCVIEGVKREELMLIFKTVPSEIIIREACLVRRELHLRFDIVSTILFGI